MQKVNSPMLLSISKANEDGEYIAKVQINDELVEFIVTVTMHAPGVFGAKGDPKVDEYFGDKSDCRTNIAKAVRIFHKGGLVQLPFKLDQNSLNW